jgi:hypothetical protein
MVRSGLSTSGWLRYRGDRMNTDAEVADGGDDAPAPEAELAIPSRPWSIAAAMEPVPPLAPPPARPGQGVAVMTTPRPAENAPGPRMLVALVLLLAAIAITVIVLLVLGR